MVIQNIKINILQHSTDCNRINTNCRLLLFVISSAVMKKVFFKYGQTGMAVKHMFSGLV